LDKIQPVAIGESKARWNLMARSEFKKLGAALRSRGANCCMAA